MDSELLDSFLRAYADDFEFALDNKIMLSWYPQRIMKRSSHSDRVLELGIGHGITCSRFADFYTHYTVIDGSQVIIDKFKTEFPQSRAQLVKSFFETYESDETFDVIVMGFVLEHVDDPGAILSRYRRFLKPSGRCFIAVPNAASLHRRFGHAAGLLDDIMALGKGDLALGHQRLFTVETLRALLASSGYDVVKQEGIFIKPFATSQIRSLDLRPEILQAMCTVGVDYPELGAALLFEARAAE